MTSYKMTNMIVIRNDGEVEIYIEGDIEYSEDKYYGENSDGKYGVRKVIIDDVKNIAALDFDGNALNLTDNEIEQAKFKLGQYFLEG